MTVITNKGDNNFIISPFCLNFFFSISAKYNITFPKHSKASTNSITWCGVEAEIEEDDADDDEEEDDDDEDEDVFAFSGLANFI